MRTRNRRLASGLAMGCSALVLLAAPAFDTPEAGLAGQQVVERETRVPFAPELGIVEVSRELRDRLDLFPEVEGFTSARLLVRDDGTTVLELESRVGGELGRERRLVSDERLAELRTTLATRLAEAGGAAGLERSGRGGFVLGHTLYGLAYHGWALPATLDLESTRANVAAYLLTAGASFYVPYRLTRDRAISATQRDLSLYGGSRGILYGVLLGDVLAGSEPDPDSDDRIRLGTGLVASVAGSALGFLGGRGETQGSAALWGVMGDFGLMAGAASAYAFGPYAPQEIREREGDIVFVRETTRNAHLGHAITLAGGVGGILAGRWMGERTAYTEGNAGVLRSAGLLGAQVGVTLARAATEDGRVIAGVGLAGGIAGIVGGDRLLSDRRFSSGEGLLVNAAQVAGGATALGLTYLVTAEIDDHPTLYLTTSTLGSLLGAGLVYAALGPGSEEVAGRVGRRGVTASFHPENLILAGATLLRSSGSSLHPGSPAPFSATAVGLPFLTLRF